MQVAAWSGSLLAWETCKRQRDTACIDAIAPGTGAQQSRSAVLRRLVGRREEAAGEERAAPRKGALKRWLADRRQSRLCCS
jgi:hypothetical protein